MTKVETAEAPPRRIVIVSGSVGAGHDGVARELAHRLRRQGFTVAVEDQLQGFSTLARFTLGAGYLLILRAAPRLYDLTCWLVERSRSVQRIADRVCGTSTTWLLDVTSDADLVIATYPPACRALGHLRGTGRLQVPVVAYLTDPAPNFLWVHPDLDLHLTAAEYTAQEVSERYGVPAVAAGPLVAERFRALGDPPAKAAVRRDARAELNLAPDDLVALLLLGSLGIGGVRRAARALSANGVRPVVLCARNDRLRRRVARIPGAIALGWRDDVPALIAAADVVVHNAGGLSLTESLVLGAPALTYAPVAGHGKANARSLARAGVAPWPRNPQELAADVCTQAATAPVAWPQDQETAVQHICTLLNDRAAASGDPASSRDASAAAAARRGADVGARRRLLRAVAAPGRERLRRFVGRRLLASSAGRRSGLAGISRLPKAFTMPLRRNGLDPLPALGALRQTEPVHAFRRVFGLQVWLVTGHEEARAVLAESHRYSTDVRSLMGEGMDGTIGGLGFTDPPAHTRLRGLLTPEFTGRRLAAMQPAIDRIIAGRLAELADAGGGVVDLMAAFAFPIPFLVICELLGLSVSDREQFRRIGSARFDVDGGGATAFGAMSQSRAFLMRAIEAQRTAPGEGLIGHLIREHGDAVTDAELAGLADGVFTGGYETSASMLGLGVVVLLGDPKAALLMRDDAAAVPRLVEELLRYLSVVQIPFPRFAREDMTLFGQPIAAGDALVCSLTAANRDAALGPRPDSFDPDRPAGSHLAFGHGIHRCVGAELARLELRAALPALLRRFPEMALAVPAEDLPYTQTSIVYGLRSLPVRLGADAGDPLS